MPRKIPHLRWIIGVMLMLAATINYLDRQTLSVVAQNVKSEFGMSNTDYAYVVDAFLLSYAVMYTAGGWLMDRIGTRWGFTIIIFFWSLVGMLHTAARSAFSLGFLRFLLGIGEGGNFPASNKVASEWFPAKDRGTASGLFNSGSALGALLAVPLVSLVTKFWGWRSAFLVTGGLGIIWMLLWMVIFRPVREHPRLTDAERDLILKGREKELEGGEESRRIPWRKILSLRETWGLIFSRFFVDAFGHFYIFWTLLYLREVRGFTLLDIGLVGWIPFLAADLGSLSGGLGSSAMVKRGWAPILARKRLMLIAALVMPLNMFIGFAPGAGLALALISAGMFFHYSWIVNVVTLVADTFPTRMVGTVTGFSGTGSVIGAQIFIFIAGNVIDAYGTYAHIFIACGLLHIIGTIIIFAAYKGRKEAIAI